MPAAGRQLEAIQNNLHLFPKTDPLPKWLWHVSRISWKTSVQLAPLPDASYAKPGDHTLCLTPSFYPKARMTQGLWEDHVTPDRGKPRRNSVHQHLGCRHTASHRASPCESFGFTATNPKLQVCYVMRDKGHYRWPGSMPAQP